MHLDFTITLGQLLTIGTLIVGFLKLYGPMAQRIWEHDIMWEKFASDNNITPHERVQYRNRTHARAPEGER